LTDLPPDLCPLKRSKAAHPEAHGRKTLSLPVMRGRRGLLSAGAPKKPHEEDTQTAEALHVRGVPRVLQD